jgi:hypothetical protein
MSPLFLLGLTTELENSEFMEFYLKIIVFYQFYPMMNGFA